MTTRPEVSDLIAGLNEDLSNEYSSVIQYRTFASVVRGSSRLTLRAFFSGEIADELSHAELLADAIAALGGTPTVSAASFTVPSDPEGMLRAALAAEEAAIERYVTRRAQADAVGEHGLAVAIDAVIEDETRHRNELRLVLADTARGSRESERPRNVAREGGVARGTSSSRRQPALDDMAASGRHGEPPSVA
ncbi:MAG TPA: ferritin-like domain-containing protein [Gemmatimonadaceae bacterium]|nr:ferritin-like domain-containing protein [Gemmatimonadaceae bacterium]